MLAPFVLWLLNQNITNWGLVRDLNYYFQQKRKNLSVFLLPQGQLCLSPIDPPGRRRTKRKGVWVKLSWRLIQWKDKMRQKTTSHLDLHLGPSGAFVLCSVTHGCDGLSAPSSQPPGSWCCLSRLLHLSSPILSANTQPTLECCLFAFWIQLCFWTLSQNNSLHISFCSSSFLERIYVLINSPWCW